MRQDLEGYGKSDIAPIEGPPAGDIDPRSPFARDYDRLIYTRAFRRLQGKTQVVSPGEGDLFRTRLTHTIEVAQAARRLAEDLNRRADDARRDAGTAGPVTADDVAALPASQQKVDPDLCEAAAVLHDLGHPPFGHAGEAALHQAVMELTAPDPKMGDARWPGAVRAGFNGNAQSFRLAVATLEHKEGTPGLQLTRATLDASLKYPWATTIHHTSEVPRAGMWTRRKPVSFATFAPTRRPRYAGRRPSKHRSWIGQMTWPTPPTMPTIGFVLATCR